MRPCCGRCRPWGCEPCPVVVRALYRSPALCTKTPRGGQSEEVPLECGVRQGDPSSPVLFNILEGGDGRERSPRG
jgi:hypothetical protein